MRNPTPEHIESRRWATLGVLCLSLLVVVVDGSIVNVALPTLVRRLHASTSTLQWVVDAYTLAMAGLLLTMGSLGDRVGRHRTLAGGLAVFGVGSALAGSSGSAGELITWRVLMGIGAAAIMPATLSIITNVFTNATERAKAIAMWSAVAGLGVAIGPTLGGWLLEHFGWGSIFMVNLPVVALALLAGRLVVPPSADAHPKALDPAGALLSMAGLVSLVFAIIEAPSNGWLSAKTLGIGAAGVTIVGAWALVELRSSHPMVDLRIFKNARFSAASFSVTMIFLALFGWLFLFTQQMQFVLGYDTLQAGVRGLPVRPHHRDDRSTRSEIGGANRHEDRCLIGARAHGAWVGTHVELDGPHRILVPARGERDRRGGDGPRHGPCHGVDHGIASSGPGWRGIGGQ